ncbi:MAG: alpha/beta fold hydrolase [Proteobacteria bacterium]|nr:alpha/beta fold hydrolase [Pseudomonadota bacterium]TDJ36259.1 MAG: alpha/beta fold hydrolase [Gammaproteobacteria bacterium]
MPRVQLLLLLLISCPPALADEVTVNHGGLILNGNLVLAKGGGIAEGVILMLHGTLGHKDMEIMQSMQSVFAENGKNSLAINLSLDTSNRHGFYPCDQPHAHKLGDASEELDVWLAWLVAQGVGDVVLFGHSRGANQVARYVVNESPLVVAAILLAPPIAPDPAGAESAGKMASGPIGGWLNDVPFLHCASARVSAESYLSYYASASLSDTPALLQEIDIPVLVFSGSDDGVVAGLVGAMASVTRSNVRHVEIDGADHFFRDLYAYDVVEITLEFLQLNQL